MNNDILAQYVRAGQSLTKAQELKRIEEIKACNHEFVIIKKGKYIGAFHSSDCGFESDTIECIHCGLTNKFIKMVESMRPHFSGLHDIYLSNKSEPFESMLFNGFLNNTDYEDINFISSDELASDYPKLLYDIAVSINPEADSQELFFIMEELNDLQTRTERLKTCTLKDAEPLIIRYKEKHKVKKIGKLSG